MAQPVSRTVTFLFTDIEGSTRLVQALGDEYAGLLEEHHALVSGAIEAAGGRVFGSEGDALFAAFDSAVPAIAAAAAAQRALAAHRWPAGGEVRVRMGIHTGQAIDTGDNYVGLSLHQVARIANAAHGGMVLVSQATRQLAQALPAGLDLRDLGERRLKDLAAAERLYQLLAEDLPSDFPPLRTLDARPNNLPLQLTSFVGRDELAAARAALDETRLLTLSGPGGTGKTRLALQLAAEAIDDFPDGVYFVALEAVRDADLVLPTIIATLGLTEAGSRPPAEHLGEYLRDRRTLLVLDNLEQVVDAGPLVTQLLRGAEQVKVIVTSRIVLRVYGEREFAVPPLGLPLPEAGGNPPSAAAALEAEAVRLFVERAQAVQPAFMLDERNVEPVVDIVRRLDGLPLAIELAAARVRILPVDDLRQRLDSRLATLTGGARDLPARQQTLRGAIDWSYELLDAKDRRMFERFAIFAGGAFLAEIEEVCGPAAELGQEVLDGLASLAEKSLLRGAITGAEEPRFAMLATIREYALERAAQAGEQADLSQRHALTYLLLLESCQPQLTGAHGGQWLDRLEQDHDNLRAALDHFVGRGDAGAAMRFTAAAWRYWQRRGYLYEARERVSAVAAMPGAVDQPPAIRARGLGAAGSICYWQGDFAAANRYYGEALAVARQADDKALLAEALYNFGFAPVPEVGDQVALYGMAIPIHKEALELYRELGDGKGMADASWALAIAAVSQRQVELAVEHGEEALRRYRELGDDFGTGWAAHMLAGYYGMTGRLAEADAMLREAMSLFAAANDPTGIVLVLLDFAVLADLQSEPERSWRLTGAADRLVRETGVGLSDTSVEFFDWRRPVRAEADESQARVWDEGEAMTTAEAIAYALSAQPAISQA